MASKKVWGWVVNWGDVAGVPGYPKEPKVTVDLFFSSKRKFKQVTGLSLVDNDLVPVRVPEDFNDLDYCPDNY